jgi:hypothetical protein
MSAEVNAVEAVDTVGQSETVGQASPGGLLEAFRVAIRAPKAHKNKPPDELYQACIGHLRQQLHDPITERRLMLRAHLEKFRKAMIDGTIYTNKIEGGLGYGNRMRDTVLTTVNVALDALPERKPKGHSAAVKRKRQQQNKFLRTLAETMGLDYHELHRLVRFEGLSPEQAVTRMGTR